MRDEQENPVDTTDIEDGSYVENMKATLGESNSKILTMKCKAPAAADGNVTLLDNFNYLHILYGFIIV